MRVIFGIPHSFNASISALTSRCIVIAKRYVCKYPPRGTNLKPCINVGGITILNVFYNSAVVVFCVDGSNCTHNFFYYKNLVKIEGL